MGRLDMYILYYMWIYVLCAYMMHPSRTYLLTSIFKAAQCNRYPSSCSCPFRRRYHKIPSHIRLTHQRKQHLRYAIYTTLPIFPALLIFLTSPIVILIPRQYPSPITHHPRLIIRQILLIATPPPEEADAILDGVDGVPDEGEDDEEADYYYCNDNVAFDHFEWWGGWVERMM